jgi:hypothetical protein
MKHDFKIGDKVEYVGYLKSLRGTVYTIARIFDGCVAEVEGYILNLDHLKPVSIESLKTDDELTLSELAEKLRPMRDTYVPYLDRVALERKEAEEKLIAKVRRGRE